ncbi:helix-turn-helix domain-containing protein [Alkalibacter saccharofermentans]|uniref:Helix-turn-helix n=1 Tax=Alkalibacter saccharofermentans DSM 14828 TaxID=1120975 RepID=A0A1M4YKK4_9FIRM|nr:helix-turn-helix transcriptional regulator [Alkalibacter saccharofermentans]SHF06270.1 Helix-turn-helix [Alkalibacter saccharofermentans DSM 14828]
MAEQKLTPFGIEVKKRLIELGKTQNELASEVGTSKVYLSMILYGKRSGEKYLPLIKDVLDIWSK